jgi:predicted CXXCH cytochrome family protein
VRGVDQSGTSEVQSARYEYEVCFRCHANGGASDFVSASYLPPLRYFLQYDESQRFSIGNPSYHPLTGDRQGTGRSLLVDYQATMYRIYCTDCHHPHGSNEPHLLRAQNWDSVPSPVTDYPLCFRCHDPNFLLNPSGTSGSATAALHRKHVLGPHDNGSTSRASCSACHDPHGVPASSGANLLNAAHLINFDKRYAGATPQYNSVGRTCTVACHSSNPRTY